MRFVDTSSQHEESSLAGWFRSLADDGIAELYLQTGYFAAGSLDFLLDTFSAEGLQDCTFGVLVGSNEPGALAADVKRLIEVVGIPRAKADLAIVCFASGLFHPKTYVARRKDSTYTAYVGSANLTPSGLAKNIEAGIILDTKEGDPEKIIIEIVSSIQSWLNKGAVNGVHKLTELSSVDALLASGILSLDRPPKSATTISATGSVKDLPKLKFLTVWPSQSIVVTAGVMPKMVGAVPSTTARGEILVAEMTKGRAGRNRQVDLKKSTAETYFGGVGTLLTCSLLSKNGAIISTQSRPVGTKSSANYYVELSGLAGAVTGSYRNRPLLLMEKQVNTITTYRYFWLYPHDPEFNMVYDALIEPKAQTRKGIQSIKRVVSYFDFHRIWAANPFV